MDDLSSGTARHRFDVTDFYRMAEAGVLKDDDRVELIEGELIDMAPIGIEHAASVMSLTHLFGQACGNGAVVSVQGPVRLDARSQLQPDIAILLPRADGYWNGLPMPDDIHLVVEVASSSLRSDRTVKLALYARAKVSEVWIVDLTRQVLEAYRDPVDGAYRTVTSHGPTARLSLLRAPDIEIALRGIFGPGACL